jgi:hypothetical protein
MRLVLCNQSAVPMGLRAGLARGEFTFPSRLDATGRAANSEFLFCHGENHLIHKLQIKNDQFCTLFLAGALGYCHGVRERQPGFTATLGDYLTRTLQLQFEGTVGLGARFFHNVAISRHMNLVYKIWCTKFGVQNLAYKIWRAGACAQPQSKAASLLTHRFDPVSTHPLPAVCDG